MDAAVDSHPVAVDEGRVTTPTQDAVLADARLVEPIDGGPLPDLEVVLPAVIESVTLFILATKYSQVLSVTHN